MKKIFSIPAVLLTVILFVVGCSDNPSSQDVNRLTLGTGLGPGNVTGDGDAFTLNPDADGIVIYFNFESKIDLGGRTVTILIEQKTGETWIEQRLFDYGPLDDVPTFYHLDNFFHSFGIGTFKATAFLGYRDIASATYIVK